MNGKLDFLFVNPDPRRSAGCNVSYLGVVSGLDKTRFRTHMAVPADNEYQDALEQLGALRIKLLINMLTYIGQTGVDTRDMSLRLTHAEGLTRLIIDNTLARGTKSVLRRFTSLKAKHE